MCSIVCSIAKDGGKPKCPPIGNWLNAVCYMKTAECHNIKEWWHSLNVCTAPSPRYIAQWKMFVWYAAISVKKMERGEKDR